jgi:hypothetical protein
MARSKRSLWPTVVRALVPKVDDVGELAHIHEKYVYSIADVTTTGHVTIYRYQPKGLQTPREDSAPEGFGPCRARLRKCEHSEMVLTLAGDAARRDNSDL